MRVLSQDMALAYDLPFISGKFVRQVAQKKFAFSPIPPFLPKSRGIKDPISTLITLCWYFLFFSFSCSTKINSVDLFWLHVEFTCVKHTQKNAVPPRDQKLPPLCPVQPQDGLVMVDLRLNTSWSIGRRWGSTSTSLQILLSRDVRRFWMPSCLCATKPVFLHDRAWLTVNRSPHAQWLGKSASCRL